MSEREPEWSPGGPPPHLQGEGEAVTPPPFEEPSYGVSYMNSPRTRLGQRGDENPGPRLTYPAGDGWVSAILGHDPGTRKLMAGALALVFVLLFVVGIWTLLGGERQGIPIIAPPLLPVKDHPVDPGGMQIMSNDTVANDMTGKGEVHLAPPPEQPDVRVLVRQGNPVQSNPIQGNPVQAGQENIDNAAHSAVPSSVVRHVAPSAHGPQQISNPVQTGQHAQPASHAAVNIPVKPDLARRKQPVELPTVFSTALQQLPPLSVRLGNKAESQMKSSGSAVSQGHYEVQLAAMDNEMQAHKEWERLQGKAPDILGRYSPIYTKVNRNGRVFVRLRISGFASLGAARLFCAKLHAHSIACTPAVF